MKKRRVVILGAAGLLGKEFVFTLKNLNNFEIFCFERKDLDITNFKKVDCIFKKINPDLVINCAAKISIEDCENNPIDAWMINVVGPGNLARSFKKINKKGIFLHFSTCDVFGSGRPPFKEGSRPRPLNIYAWSKLCGEKIIEEELLETNKKYYIARIGLLYGINKNTLIDAISLSLLDNKKIDIVFDQYSIPSWTKDVVDQALNLILNNKNKSGIYHFVNEYKKIPSRYDIAVFIAETLSKNKSLINKRRLSSLFVVPKPLKAILTSEKIRFMRNWKNSLKEYLIIKGYLINKN